MANSTQYAKTIAASPSKISTTELHGRVRIAYADFTAAEHKKLSICLSYQMVLE